MGQSSDILGLMRDLIENDIKAQLAKPLLSRAYDGRTKPVSKSKSPSFRRDWGKNLSAALEVNVVTLPDGAVTIAVTMPNYWVYVNYGRRGKQQNAAVKYPPLGAISEWITTKGLPQFRDSRGRFISNNQRLFLVQRSIGEYGIFPTLFLQKAQEETEERIVFYLGEYGRTLLQELLEKGTLFR